MSVLNQSGEEQVECPLCMEPLEVDDLNFFPCTCGYQICRFCWHRIRTDENGLCPACRKGYPENPADFKPLSQEEVAKLKAEKRHKDQQRKQKITENRKHLANVRVVQRNLVFVVGLPMRLADSEVLKKHEYFGKFGKIHKVVINQCTSYAGTQGPSASAYVTYQRADDALRAIQAVNNISVDGRSIKSSLGTTKYCSHFMKNQACPKADCMYLHEQGDPEASFTKEEMQGGKHQEYEKKLHDQLINATNLRERKPIPSPPAISLPNNIQPNQAGNKEAWPSLQSGNLATPSTTNGSLTNGSNGTLKGENGRKLSVTKKRHSSGDDTNRGKTKDKQHLYSGSDENEGSPQNDSLLDDDLPLSTSESVSLDSSDESVKYDMKPITPSSSSSARLVSITQHRGPTLFEPDNNSFFSTNNFTKVPTSTQGSGLEWQMNGMTQTHMPDIMPTVHPTEDWQAAFGFTNNVASEKNSIDSTSIQQHNEEEHLRNNADILRQEKFLLEEFSSDSNPGHIFNSLHSQYQMQDPTHYLVNGVQYQQPEAPTSKFFSDYHLRRQPSTLEQANNYATHLQQPQPSSYGKNPHLEGSTNYIVNNHMEDLNQFDCNNSFNGHLIDESEVDEKYNNVDLGESEGVNDDWGFDLFHETQKALAEMMEKESSLQSNVQRSTLNHYNNGASGVYHHPTPFNSGSKLLPGFNQQQIQAQQIQQSQQNHRVTGCSRLLDGLGLGASTTRSRLPPPGFSTTPNHMNAFGLGIPRAPSNTVSKILPFMSNGSLSPTPHQSVLFPPSRGYTHSNKPPMPDTVQGQMHWSENLRGIVPMTSSPPPTQNNSMQFNTTQQNNASKGWTGPCTDWTALDPAIVSSSRPAPLLLHNNQQNQQITGTTHWLRHLEENNSLYFGGQHSDWSNTLGTPPPGFGMRQQNATGKALSTGADMNKIDNL